MVHGLIQVAGVKDLDEARMLARAGVDWIGFPLRLAVHEPDLSEDQTRRMIAELPSSVTPVLITYLDRATEILAFCRQLGVETVQLHGDIELSELRALRTIAPRLFVVKSLIVKGAGGDNSVLMATVSALDGLVDAFITDTHDPVTGACGATGLTHDWGVSRDLAAASRVPVILAGGLTPSNVRRAIREVAPDGVDVHTGIEDEKGDKDPELVQQFVAAANAGFADNAGKRS